MELLEKFDQLLAARIHRNEGFSGFGEDSVRLDFCISLLQLLEIQPHQLLLEIPIPECRFSISEKKERKKNQGRLDDKPEIDLIVNPVDDVCEGLVVEFAFFRRPKNAKSSAKTKQHLKLMNDILRLALMKNHDKYKNYKHLMVCLSDDEMIDYGQPGKRGPKALPILSEYTISDEFMKRFEGKSTTKLDSRFWSKAKEFEVIPNAKRFFNKSHDKTGHISKWALWVWEVTV